jgi:hypothetical protein
MKKNQKTRLEIITGGDLKIGDQFVFSYNGCSCVFKIKKRKAGLFIATLMKEDKNCFHRKGLVTGVTFWAQVIKVST